MVPALRVRIPPPKEGNGQTVAAKPKPPVPSPDTELLDDELNDDDGFLRQESGGLEWLARGRRQAVCCRGKQRETYNTSGQSRQAAEGAGAANRAAAVGSVALDAKARWKLAEAAVSGAAARSACQHE